MKIITLTFVSLCCLLSMPSGADILVDGDCHIQLAHGVFHDGSSMELRNVLRTRGYTLLNSSHSLTGLELIILDGSAKNMMIKQRFKCGSRTCSDEACLSSIIWEGDVSDLPSCKINESVRQARVEKQSYNYLGNDDNCDSD